MAESARVRRANAMSMTNTKRWRHRSCIGLTGGVKVNAGTIGSGCLGPPRPAPPGPVPPPPPRDAACASFFCCALSFAMAIICLSLTVWFTHFKACEIPVAGFLLLQRFHPVHSGARREMAPGHPGDGYHTRIEPSVEWTLAAYDA